ncbi:hypothetical protein SGLAM104S_03291 [Streptomyces glaucescens]
MLGGPPLKAARRAEAVLHRRIGRFFTSYDVVLAPTTATPPPRIGALLELGPLATDRAIIAACSAARCGTVRRTTPAFGSRCGQEADGERLVEQPAAVVAEDGDGGRVDDTVRVERVAVGAVVVELRGPQQAGVQGGGAAQRLLLGLGAVEVTAAGGPAAEGEVQDRPGAETPGGLGGCSRR